MWRFCCDTFVITGNTLWYYSIVIYAVIPNCKATLQPISLVSAEVSKPVLKRNMAHLIWNTQNTRHHRVSGITCCICHQLSLSLAHMPAFRKTHTPKESNGKSPRINILNKKMFNPKKSTAHTASPINYLHSALWKDTTLLCAHMPCRKSAKWSEVCCVINIHYYRGWHQVIPSIYSLFTDSHISYLI